MNDSSFGRELKKVESFSMYRLNDRLKSLNYASAMSGSLGAFFFGGVLFGVGDAPMLSSLAAAASLWFYFGNEVKKNIVKEQIRKLHRSEDS